MCTTVRGGGTESIEPAKERKSTRHMQHSPRAAEVRGVRIPLNGSLPSFSLSGAPASFLTTGAGASSCPFTCTKENSRHDCQNYRSIALLSVPGKVFAHVLLSRVRQRLQEKRRIQQQSGFAPRSTVERIVTLNMLQQSRREYNRPLWVAYIDLKTTFDSVDLNALWLLLASIGLPLEIINLFKALYYTDTLSTR